MSVVMGRSKCVMNVSARMHSEVGRRGESLLELLLLLGRHYPSPNSAVTRVHCQGLYASFNGIHSKPPSATILEFPNAVMVPAASISRRRLIGALVDQVFVPGS
jgi:hypothetical protein